MQQYPYNTPIVMTDETFLLYGGMTGTSGDAQRQIAYGLAEEQMTEYIHSFLIPTIVTGTFFWRGGNPIILDYGNITNVLLVAINSHDWSNGCTLTSTTGCYAVRGDGRYGAIDVQALVNCSGCGQVVSPPYNVQVVYESGLQTGTSFGNSMLQALTLASQINLNELDFSLSNEGTADVGIQNFSNQKYTETRITLGTTAFGNSAVAQRIARLVRKYRTKPVVGFR